MTYTQFLEFLIQSIEKVLIERKPFNDFYLCFVCDNWDKEKDVEYAIIREFEKISNVRFGSLVLHRETLKATIERIIKAWGVFSFDSQILSSTLGLPFVVQHHENAITRNKLRVEWLKMLKTQSAIEGE